MANWRYRVFGGLAVVLLACSACVADEVFLFAALGNGIDIAFPPGQEEDKMGAVGMLISVIDGVCMVCKLAKGSPAEKAGIRVGQRVLAVNGDDISGRSKAEVAFKASSFCGRVLQSGTCFL